MFVWFDVILRKAELSSGSLIGMFEADETTGGLRALFLKPLMLRHTCFIGVVGFKPWQNSLNLLLFLVFNMSAVLAVTSLNAWYFGSEQSFFYFLLLGSTPHPTRWPESES